MTTYTITTTQNMTQLAGKVGGDAYNINGAELIINTDTRYGPNTSPTIGPTGNITVSATLGGTLTIEGFSVRLIPYNNGTGNVPPSGTILTQGGVTCELLCAMSLRTGGTVTGSGATLPTTGWLKVRGVTGGLVVAGAFTGGISASATASDETGWILLAGVRDRGFSIPRLGYMNVDGRMFSVGTTTGVRGQTIQLPHYTVDQVTAYPGVEIETAPGSGVYQFWPNAANKFASTDSSTDTRSSFVGITNDGVVTIGMGRDAVAAGALPVAGCNVRIPNIILQSTETTNLNVSVQPFTTMGTRFDSTFSGAGRLNHSCSTGAWYWNIVQPYSIYIRDLHTCDQIVIQETATLADIDRLHAGLSNYITPYASNSIVFQQCYNGGIIGEISGLRAEATSTSGYCMSLTNLYGGWTFRKIRAGQTGVATAVSGAIIFNTCDDTTVDLIESFTKRLLVSACNRLRLKRHIYADNCIGTTQTTVGTHAVECMSQSADVEITNIENWPGVANCHPYNGLFFSNTTKRGSLRYCGTDVAPYNGGSANLMGYIYSDGGNNDECKVQRNWTTGLRLGVSSGTNTTNRFHVENNYMTDASKTVGPQQSNSFSRGNRCNGGSVPTSYIAVYGTCMWDSFTGDNTTRAALALAEKSLYYPDLYQITAGTPVFTAQGALVMRTIGDAVVWTWPWRILGWNGLTTMASQGTNTANHLFEYDLDKGTGFSGAWKVLSNTNLAAETGIDPVVGFIPKLRVSCIAASSINRLDSLRFDGTTTLALQNAALYPLDLATLTMTGIQPDSTIAVFVGAAASILPGQLPVASTSGTGTSVVLNYVYNTSIPTYTVRIRKAGYDCIELEYANVLNPTIPVAQQLNADGFGVQVYSRGTGSTSAFVTIDASALRIDIGNTRTVAEDVYNAVALWQATPGGITYPEALRFDGTDMLLLGSWRFRRALAAYTAAGIDAVPVIDGNVTGSPDDETNGSVDFRARSVRTYQFNAAPALTADDVAAAVWNFAHGNGATAEANLRGARAAAENAFAVSA
jgi:hypothetical protein